MISVVIPVKAATGHEAGARHARLNRLLDQLENQTEAPDTEILLVSNPPDPALQDLAKARGSAFRYLEVQDRGANFARNRGIEESRGEIIVFLDDDCALPDRRFLSEHLQTHRSHPGATAIGGPYLLPEKTNAPSRLYARIQKSWFEAAKTSGKNCSWLLGGNCSFKPALLRGSRFDERLRYGATETEFFLRLGRQGHRFVAHDSLAIVHDAAVSALGLAEKAYWQGMGAGFIGSRGLAPRYINSGNSARASTKTCGERFYHACFQAGFRSFIVGRPAPTGKLSLFSRIAFEGSRQTWNGLRRGVISGYFFCLRAVLATRKKSRS